MRGIEKIGYFLVGLGVGLLANGMLLDFELRRPLEKDQPILSHSNESKTGIQSTNHENNKDSLRKDLKGSQGYSSRTNYAHFFDEVDEIEKAEKEHPIDEDEEPEVKHIEVVDEDAEPQIFPISEDEFVTAESSGYDKVAVTYYEDDNTYADDATDTVLTAFEDHIGDNPIEFDEDDMAYIRNEDESTDYSIHRVETGYVDAVLGISSDEAPDIRRGPRKMRKNDYD